MPSFAVYNVVEKYINHSIEWNSQFEFKWNKYRIKLQLKKNL